ncbi:hypothetical protein V8C37DRAFT_376926 [Trichoderma ceciliae]
MYSVLHPYSVSAALLTWCLELLASCCLASNSHDNAISTNAHRQHKCRVCQSRTRSHEPNWHVNCTGAYPDYSATAATASMYILSQCRDQH